MPNPVERLRHVQEYTRAVLFILEGRGNLVNYSVDLVNCGVGGSESELVWREYWFNERIEAGEEEFL